MMKQDMFGSNNITEINEIVLDHVNPSSMLDSYLHFPDPFLDAAADDLFLNHFLSQQQQHQVFIGENCWQEQEQEQEQEEEEDKAATTTTTIIEVVEKKKMKKKCSSSSNRRTGSSSTKRRGKKDRHSKICTAQGPRDRRMRLSLQIARKFFDLQDMLGFDKASKTIDWLLSNSNSAIKDLKNTFNNNSGFSYGSSVCCSGSSEVLSEIIIKDDNNNVVTTTTLKDIKKTRQLRTVARDSRDRARARARQRTLFKKTKPISISQLQNSAQLQDPSIHSFSSGNNNNNNNTLFQTLDYPLLSCPNSIFMASPFPKPYSFSDSTLLKLP